MIWKIKIWKIKNGQFVSDNYDPLIDVVVEIVLAFSETNHLY